MVAPQDRQETAEAYAAGLSALDLNAFKQTKDRMRADIYVAMREAIKKELE